MGALRHNLLNCVERDFAERGCAESTEQRVYV